MLEKASIGKQKYTEFLDDAAYHLDEARRLLLEAHDRADKTIPQAAKSATAEAKNSASMALEILRSLEKGGGI